MGNSMRMSMKDFDALMQSIYPERPFRMYLHGCPKENCEYMVNDPSNNFYINRDRNSIASTVANGGTVRTDYHARFQGYKYSDTDSNLVLIMPDVISIERYCGAIEGQLGVTRGYANHLELDYTIMATNQIMNGRIIDMPHLSEANNCLVLGYYDHNTDEFVLNQNCILFKDQPEFEDLTSKIRDLANAQYNDKIDLELLHGLVLSTKSPEEKLAIQKIYSDPELKDIYRQMSHVEYMLSPESKLDADYENSNLLVDYENLTYSAVGRTIDKMVTTIMETPPSNDDTPSEIDESIDNL